MIRRLSSLGKPWRLYYCARTRKNAAFLPELRELSAGDPARVIYNYDGERGGKLLDLVRRGLPRARGRPPLLLRPAADAGGLRAGHGAHDRPDRVHVEYFAAKDAPALDGGFVVELARTGTAITVPAGKSILDAVLDAGVQVPYSCMEGVCGTCETTVLEGLPEHRDLDPQQGREGSQQDDDDLLLGLQRGQACARPLRRPDGRPRDEPHRPRDRDVAQPPARRSTRRSGRSAGRTTSSARRSSWPTAGLSLTASSRPRSAAAMRPTPRPNALPNRPPPLRPRSTGWPRRSGAPRPMWWWSSATTRRSCSAWPTCRRSPSMSATRSSPIPRAKSRPICPPGTRRRTSAT